MPRLAKTLSVAMPRQKPASSQFQIHSANVGQHRPCFTSSIFFKKLVTESNQPAIVCLFTANALLTDRCCGFLSVSFFDHLLRNPSHQSRPGKPLVNGLGRFLSFRYSRTNSPTNRLVSPNPSSCKTCQC